MMFFLEKTWPFWLLAALLAALIAWVIHRWSRGPKVSDSNITAVPLVGAAASDVELEADHEAKLAQQRKELEAQCTRKCADLEAEAARKQAELEAKIAELEADVTRLEGEVSAAPVPLVAAIPAAAPAAVPDVKEGTRVLGFVVKLDDLKVVEGIGPKIEGLLRDGGISTWRELAEVPVERLQEILDAAGPRYQVHNPATWPRQAELLADADWAKFKTWTEELTAGRE